jgi:SAM-dependent methyltransferase
MIDWGDGEYEDTARQLEPVAEVLVRAAAIHPGEEVLDVACGTGNAALLAARGGGRVTGVDAAARLVEVARGRATEEGVEAKFETADAAALPFGDGAFDVALSVFGVIFAAPAERAATELLRVVRPGGRIVLTSWAPEGPIHEAGRLAAAAVAAAEGGEPQPPRTPGWGDPDVLRRWFAPAAVAVRDEQLAFSAQSLELWLHEHHAHHPRCGARSVHGWRGPERGPSSSGAWMRCSSRPTRTLARSA